MTDHTFVYLDDELGLPVQVGVAYFTQRRNGPISTTFRYEQSWLARRGAYALDPELPLVTGGLSTPGKLPGAFSDASPDRWGRGLITKRALGAAPGLQLTDVDFLLGVSDHNRQGALRFAVSEGGEFQNPGPDIPKMIALPALLRAADEVTRDPDDQAALKRLLDAGTGSLGGARPKASVRDGTRLKIAKFPNILSDDWDVMAWEHSVLELARLAGISVPTTDLLQIDGRHVLLLDRFDRETAGRRIPYISAMTIVSGVDGERHDYIELVEAIEEQGSRVAADLRELWRRVAFSVLVHNTDDHFRNHGFLRPLAGGWSLSPAFDINPNPDLGAQRASSISGAVDVADELDGLRELAMACRLTTEAARDELATIATAVSSNWERVAHDCHIGEGERKRFAPVFHRAKQLAP